MCTMLAYDLAKFKVKTSKSKNKTKQVHVVSNVCSLTMFGFSILLDFIRNILIHSQHNNE